MSGTNKYSVFYEPDDTETLWSKTPFNYKKDVKNISHEKLLSLSEELGNAIHYGINRPPASSAVYWGKKRLVALSKVRLNDENSDNGKSGGYRCIALIDLCNNAIFVLHIYKHNKEEDRSVNKELSKRKKNKLKSLVDEYTQSLLEE